MDVVPITADTCGSALPNVPENEAFGRGTLGISVW